jgi:hypothetical protein
MANEEQLLLAVEQSWNATTTYHRKFHPDSAERKRLGQSGPTALLLQDFLGGKIMAQTVELPYGERMVHYYNDVDGKILDPTRAQYDFYPEPVAFGEPTEAPRESFDVYHPETHLYEVLRHHVTLCLPPEPVLK